MFRVFLKALTGVIGGAFLALLPSTDRPVAAQEAYIGAIEFVGFDYAPRDWALCDGQILKITEYGALFSLLGNKFGGDGRTTFALPDLRGRSPIHDGGSAGAGLTPRPLGNRGGQERIVLAANQVPIHSHVLKGTTATGNQVLPTGHAFADDSPDETYAPDAPETDMHGDAIGASPSQGHENMSPFQTVNCIIALDGIYPPRH